MRIRIQSFVGRAVVLLTLFAPTFARAEDATAEALYQEGRRALTAGDLDLACRKFAESDRLESAPGTLLNLGDCEERRGHLVAARDSFAKAIAKFRANDTRLTYAKERLERVEKRLSRLTIRLGGAPPADTRIEIDGVATAPGKRLDLDRGTHHVLVKAPGHLDSANSVELAEGESRDLEVTAGPSSASPKSETAVPVVVSSDVSSPPPAAKTSPLVTTAMWASFGLAAAGIVVGSYGGFRTLDAKDTVDENCKPVCNATGSAAQDDGRTWGTVSTVGFVVGGTALAAGIVLFFVKQSAAKSAFGVSPYAKVPALAITF